MPVTRALVLALMLGLGTDSTVLAAEPDGRSPDTALPLTGESAQWGSLVGTSGGAFYYFWIDYPGDSTDVMLSLEYTPAEARIADAIGLRVYQGSVLLGGVSGMDGGPGHNKLTFLSDRKSPVLVQVSNYTPQREVFFKLTAAGPSLKSSDDAHKDEHEH